MFRIAFLILPTIATACVDFSSFQPGHIVTTLGDGVRVEGFVKPRKLKPDVKPGNCMIFDSSNPTGDDFDLGTPNEAFGGPGIGLAGGKPNFPNPTALGNVLILSENGNSTNPDDNKNGGLFHFYFDPPTYIDTMGLLDTESPVLIKVYTLDGMTELQNSGRGDNSFDRVFIGLPNVRKIIVKVSDSAAITDIACSAIPACLPDVDIDFETFQTGATVSDLGNGVSVTANRFTKTGLELAEAMIFDSSFPTGGDSDLGTPHESVGGPGRGRGGRQGRPFENVIARGKILIISEDGDSSDPDDEANGGIMEFTFSNPVYISDIGLLDHEEGARVVAITVDGQSKGIDIPPRDNNSFETIQIQLPAVIGLSVQFAGSAALTHIKASKCGNGSPAILSLTPVKSPSAAPTGAQSAASSYYVPRIPSSSPSAEPHVQRSRKPSAAPSSEQSAAASAASSIAPSILRRRVPTASPSDATSSNKPNLCKSDLKLDFEPYHAGDIVNDLGGGIAVTASLHSKQGFLPGDAMIFDSSLPSGGDFDLGTPHESVGGPGKGNGGQKGQSFENVKARGKILIISEDGDHTDPDDAAQGGKLNFTFARPLSVRDVGLLDNEEGTKFVATMKNGKTSEIYVPGSGDNSFQTVQIQLSQVIALSMEFGGSAAVTHITVSPCEEY